MIRRTVSAALLLRDGFTRRPLSASAVVLRSADGGRCPAVRKPGGWLILTDLPEGPQELLLRCVGFRDEPLRLEPREGPVREQAVDLTPDERYPYPQGTAFLSLTLNSGGAADAALWAGRSGMPRLTVLQAKAGQEKPLLLCRGPRENLPLPGAFLLPAGKKPELLRLRELNSGGEAAADAPPESTRKRGEELVPVRRVRVEPDGTARVAFPDAGKVWLFCDGVSREVELYAGRQELVWDPSAEKKAAK